MSVLRVYGQSLDLDAALAACRLKVCATQCRGEKGVSDSDRGFSQNAIFVEFTDVGIDDFERQVENALSFLSQNQTAIADLVGARGVEEAYLDCCIPRLDVAAQSAVFSTRLVHAAGRLNLGLCLSLYEVS
ncbi:hypothetical protein Mal48_06260 [Thalassoglobus polymorphus]|uniref:DUF4279 domain-containing protein n=2 Tax=Thalassoglobus polymorphus TaxID=2527994 RepID=A0A517QIC9_9PLAN|nr:hypothetical protein Mal48_06260 [Thalassoglobus polymorphus]